MNWEAVIFAVLSMSAAWLAFGYRWRMLEAAARETMEQGRNMQEQASANHRYALHLLRVARDHEVQAKRYLMAARKERGE